MSSGSRKWLLGAGSLFLVLLGYVLLFPRAETNEIGAHESLAVERLRTIVQEQEDFRAAQNSGFADALSQLRDVTSSDHAYTYSLEVTARNGQGRASKYVVTASPALLGKTGTRYFSIDETGTLRSELMHAVTTSSPVLQ